tara:strand:+ start:308 stop:412 length:105 start_codon:yes stop_codon:yes gene_type:complete
MNENKIFIQSEIFGFCKNDLKKDLIIQTKDVLMN